MAINKTKLIYQLADFAGAIFSALSLSVVFVTGGASGGCRSLSDGSSYEIAFTILAIFSYIFAFVLVWKIYYKFIDKFFLRKLTWLFIAVLGLFTASIFWGVIESIQCGEPLVDKLAESLAGASRISIYFIPMMLPAFIVAFTIDLVINIEDK